MDGRPASPIDLRQCQYRFSSVQCQGNVWIIIAGQLRSRKWIESTGTHAVQLRE